MNLLRIYLRSLTDTIFSFDASGAVRAPLREDESTIFSQHPLSFEGYQDVYCPVKLALIAGRPVGLPPC